jgi:diguanylate cyclase (GGDEF)-like protein/PAS domain S-box-containing protein
LVWWGYVEASDPVAPRWVKPAVVALLVLVGVGDLLLPSSPIALLLVIPVVVAAAFLPPRATIAVTGVALVITVITGLSPNDFAEWEGWLELGAIAGVGVAVYSLATTLAQYRASLREESEQFRMLAENATDIVARISPEGLVTWVSPSVEDRLGWRPVELVGSPAFLLVDAADRDAVVEAFTKTLGGEFVPSTMTVRVRRADDQVVWMTSHGTMTADGSVVVGFRLVDDEVRALRSLNEAEAKYRMLAENAMDTVVSLDMDATITWVSPSIETLLGYSPQEVVGEHKSTLVHIDDVGTLHEADESARHGASTECRIRMITSAGVERWVDATPRPLHDSAGAIVGTVIGVRDVQAEVETRAALEHEVRFDALNGLAGRSLALDRIRSILETRKVPGWALTCIGVDGMTQVNQAYTHQTGDAVLRAVAHRLVEAAGAEDRVARLAGDEFVILQPEIVTATDAANSAERLLAAVRGQVSVHGFTVDVTCCAGIAMHADEDADELLRDATAAMRQASAKGPDRWEFLDGNVGQETRRALDTRTGISTRSRTVESSHG